MRALVCSMLMLSVAIAPAFAQDYEAMATRLEQSMAEAQAQAIRSGDEQLTCTQLETEMTTTMQDPTVQSVIASQGAYGQQRLDEMNAARGRAQAQMGFNMFLGLASSFIPGAGYAQMAAQQAQAAQMRAQQQQNVSEMMAMAEQMTTIMPQLMRGQRIYELAQAQQCAFVQEQTQ